MVIVLEDDPSKLADAEPSRPRSRSPSVPPPYSYAPHETDSLLPPFAPKSRTSPALRFARAYAIAVLLFCSVAVFLSQSFDRTHPAVS